MAGISSKIGNYAFAKQSAKGTAAGAPVIRLLQNGEPSLAPFKNRERFELTDSSQDPGGTYTSMLGVAGDIPVYLHPDAAAFLFYAVFGASADSGAVNFTHVITPANDVPYLTIWRNVGDVVLEKFTDCKVSAIRFEGSAGSPISCTLSIVGIKSDWTGADPVLTPISTQPYIFPEAAATLKVDTVAYPIDRISFGLNRNVSPWQADDFIAQDLDPGAREWDLSFATRLTSATAEPLNYKLFNYGGGTTQVGTLTARAIDFKWTRDANTSIQIAATQVTYASVPVFSSPGGAPIHVEVACMIEKPSGSTPAVTVTVKDQKATPTT